MALTNLEYTERPGVLYREDLKTGRIYVSRKDGGALFSPDGEGAIFYDSLEEAVEDTGLTVVEYVERDDLDHMDD